MINTSQIVETKDYVMSALIIHHKSFRYIHWCINFAFARQQLYLMTRRNSSTKHMN